jgi:hypothetical protein
LQSVEKLRGEESVSNVIDFLERFGRDAELRHASDEAVDEALRQAGIDPAVRLAIIGKDQGELVRLLGADTNVCCLVNAPDEEEEEEEDDDEEEEEEEEEENSLKSLDRATERVA